MKKNRLLMLAGEPAACGLPSSRYAAVADFMVACNWVAKNT